MELSMNELQSLHALAHLETHSDQLAHLAKEINSIMDFAEQLKQVETADVTPLFHPMDLTQPLRSDEVTEDNCIQQLAEIAPCFENDLYLVPKIIDTGV